MIWDFAWVGHGRPAGGLVASSIRILREYERGVVFTLGRFWKVKGPGLVILVPGDPAAGEGGPAHRRVRGADAGRDFARQRVGEGQRRRLPSRHRCGEGDHPGRELLNATSQLAQTTLRSVLGKHELDDMLAGREKLNLDIQQALDAQTNSWGIKVSNVEIKQVDLTESMIRAIARQAEAERERRAKVIHAEGELQASEKLYQAAKVLAQEPQAIQLRYLETLTVIGADKNTTIVFPLPMDVLTPFLQRSVRGTS